MRKQDLFQISAYILVSVLSVGAAFLVSLKFMGPSRAQEPAAPPASEAPANPATSAPPADASAQPGTPAPPAGEVNPANVAAMANTGISELEGFLEPFIYDIVNRRDPFQAYAEYVPIDENNNRPLSPAQKFELEQLKLIGIMWDVKDPKAMFVDPDSEVLVLGRDESIGNRNGYIAAIREGEVVVVEAVRKRGDIIYRTRVLRMER